MKIHVLVLHFNNPLALGQTLENIISFNLRTASIVVFDNGSNLIDSDESKKLASDLQCQWMGSKKNQGWGGAINYYMKSRRWNSDDLVMISAHDAIIKKMDVPKIQSAFSDPSVAFVCPQYPVPEIATYSLARSFKSAPGVGPLNNKVTIGHATLCVARATALLDHPFDENFFVYGCESEIFLRIQDHGLITLLCNDFIVTNNTTDSSSDFRTRAFTINSIYVAGKRGGKSGIFKRSIIIFSSIIRLYLNGKAHESRIKLESLWFALSNPGMGFSRWMKKLGK